MAKNINENQTAAYTEILYQSIYTLQNLWTSAFCIKENMVSAEYVSVN